MIDDDAKKNAKTLETWFATRDEYMAPELGPKIVGYPPGDRQNSVITSPVIEASGRFVRTLSGRTYRLGDVDPAYLANLKANRYPFDPENPIRIVDETTVLLANEEIN